MKKLLIVLAGLSMVPAFAQDIDQQIEANAARLNEIINQQQMHRYMQPNAKANLLAQLKGAIRIVTGNQAPPSPPRPVPPQPSPQLSAAQCAWFDGQSNGIATRGWHAFRLVNGVYYSLQYYDNNSTASAQACQQDLIFKHDAPAYRGEVARAKRSACACAWYPGDVLGQPSQRGWHMAYTMNLLDGSAVTLSSGYYDNNSTASQETCNRALVSNGFVCR